MSEIGTGIEYPKLTIDGREYDVKFSRSALYRLDKAGFDIRTLGQEIGRWFPHQDPVTKEQVNGNIRISVLVDVLHAAIGDQVRVTPEQLADMVLPISLPPSEISARTAEIAIAITKAIAKTRPPVQPVAPAAAANGAQPN